jgi:hypothetical protein
MTHSTLRHRNTIENMITVVKVENQKNPFVHPPYVFPDVKSHFRRARKKLSPVIFLSRFRLRNRVCVVGGAFFASCLRVSWFFFMMPTSVLLEGNTPLPEPPPHARRGNAEGRPKGEPRRRPMAKDQSQ